MAGERGQSDQRELLLPSVDKSLTFQEHEGFSSASFRQHRRWVPLIPSLIVSIILLVSLAWNGILYQQNKSLAERMYMGYSKNTGLPTNRPTIYEYHNDYWDGNQTLANKLWDDINLDASVVALSQDYIVSHNLEPSTPFPWDGTKDLYFVKVMHQLHCLKYMRKAYMDLEAGVEAVITSEHVQHCFDALRQDIACKADDTLMPALGDIGDQQTLQCRDLNKVVEWAKAPEQNACFQDGNDFRPKVNKLEFYASCPADSPYRSIADGYFEEHGHKNPYGDD